MSKSKYWGYALNDLPSPAEKELILKLIGPISGDSANDSGIGNNGAADSGASGEDWRSLVPPNVSPAESVPGWAKLLPTLDGYGLEHYDKFFVKYTALVGARPTPGTGPLLPERTYVEKWVENPVWLAAAGAAEAEEILAIYDGLGGTPDASADANIWSLFGKMLGIAPKMVPSCARQGADREVENYYCHHWYDIKDILFSLYTDEPNARRDNLAEIADQVRDGDVRELAKQDPAAAAAEQALKIKAAKSIMEALSNNKTLTEAQLQALRALAKGNDEYFSNKIRESDQCILRLNLESFMRPYYENRHQETIHGSPPRKRDGGRPHKSIYQDSGRPVTSMNKLAYSPNSAPFLQARTHEISQLMPMIRLYKTYYDDETNEINKEVELYFDGGVSAAQALSGRTGVGIKNFEWSLNATNPSTVKNDITAKLVLYFQSFNDLLSTRWGKDIITGKSEEFRYEDLLLRPPAAARDKDLGSITAPNSGACTKNTADLDSRFYEVKAVVGWAPPVRFEGQQTPGLVNAMRSQQIPLFLTLIDHEFAFTQEGTFELSITYRARMEAMGMDPRLDILTTTEVKKEIDRMQKEIQVLKKVCDSQESIDKKREEIALQRGIDSDNLASNIIKQLERYIYFSKIKTAPLQDAILGISSTSPSVVIDLVITEGQINMSIADRDNTLKPDVLLELQKNTVDTPKKGTSEAKKAKDAAATGGDEIEDPANFSFDDGDTEYSNIPWFYFGDLVDIVVKNAMKNNAPGDISAQGIIPGLELDNLVFLLGTYDYEKITANGTSSEVGQLSSVPITVAAYNSWFVRNIVNSQRSSFPIIEFLRSFIKEAVLPILNRRCFDNPTFIHAWTTGVDNAFQRPWIEISPLISKSAAVSMASNQGSLAASERGKNKLGSNPLEKFRVNAHSANDLGDDFVGPTQPMITDSEINLGSFNPSTGNIPTQRENSHAQTIRNSYHVTVFYLIGQDAYKTLGKVVVPTGKKDKAGFVETYDFNNDGNLNSFEMYAAREDRDYKQGVYHLYLGADRGLVKEATFSKVDVPYLREARIQQDALNPLALLAATYNINLKMVGNTVFWPGQYIFVNPVGYGSGLGLPDQCGSVSNQLGLGGYHLITQVKSYIENGKFETTIKGLFEFSGDGKPSLPQHTPDDECGENSSMAGSAQEVTTP